MSNYQKVKFDTMVEQLRAARLKEAIMLLGSRNLLALPAPVEVTP